MVALPVMNPLSVSMSLLRKLCRAFRVDRNEQAYTARRRRQSKRSVRLERRDVDGLTAHAEVIGRFRDDYLWELQILSTGCRSEDGWRTGDCERTVTSATTAETL